MPSIIILFQCHSFSNAIYNHSFSNAIFIRFSFTNTFFYCVSCFFFLFFSFFFLFAALKLSWVFQKEKKIQFERFVVFTLPFIFVWSSLERHIAKFSLLFRWLLEIFHRFGLNAPLSLVMYASDTVLNF